MKNKDLHLGAAKVRVYRRVVEDTEKNLTGIVIDGAIVVMFILTCYMLYNAIVWSIWS